MTQHASNMSGTADLGNVLADSTASGILPIAFALIVFMALLAVIGIALSYRAYLMSQRALRLAKRCFELFVTGMIPTGVLLVLALGVYSFSTAEPSTRTTIATVAGGLAAAFGAVVGIGWITEIYVRRLKQFRADATDASSESAEGTRA